MLADIDVNVVVCVAVTVIVEAGAVIVRGRLAVAVTVCGMIVSMRTLQTTLTGYFLGDEPVPRERGGAARATTAPPCLAPDTSSLALRPPGVGMGNTKPAGIGTVVVATPETVEVVVVLAVTLVVVETSNTNQRECFVVIAVCAHS